VSLLRLTVRASMLVATSPLHDALPIWFTFALRGLRDSARIEGSWSLRALIVLPLAFVAFGVLMEHAGFIPAMLALTVGSAAAGRSEEHTSELQSPDHLVSRLLLAKNDI